MFDPQAFTQSKFVVRTAVVPVPDLAAWFTDGEPAQFEVRGLTGNEMAICNEAATKRTNIEMIITALKLTDEHAKALQKLLGTTEDVPGEIAKKLEMLNIVFPGLGFPVWIKLCDTFPMVFYQLTNKILELTGQGKAVEKPLPSGEIQASEH